MRPKKSTRTITVRLPIPIYDKLLKDAMMSNRSLSQQVITILETRFFSKKLLESIAQENKNAARSEI